MTNKTPWADGESLEEKARNKQCIELVESLFDLYNDAFPDGLRIDDIITVAKSLAIFEAYTFSRLGMKENEAMQVIQLKAKNTFHYFEKISDPKSGFKAFLQREKER